MSSSTPTANQISGRATGALFFTAFGGIWLTLGIYVRGLVTPFTVLIISVGLAILFPACFWLMRRSKSFPTVPEDPEVSRTFRRVNIAQWLAIAVVAFAFDRLHFDAYVVSAMTAIVGLHLFPLARLFRYPMHHATAIALVLWAGIGLLVVPADQLQGTTAIGTGTILWVSAAISLFNAGRTVLRPRSDSDPTSPLLA